MNQFSYQYFDTSSLFHGFIPNIMGTRLDLIITEFSQHDAIELWNKIAYELKQLHKMLNRFDTTSEISVLNKKLKKEKQVVNISEEVWNILIDCKHYFLKTHQLFDISRRDLSQVHFNVEEKRISTRSSLLDFDLGGYAKGYAVQKIKEMLLSFGVKHAFVNFGDSSIAGIGHHPHGDCWKVSIKNPFEINEIIREVELRDEDLSTSGNTLTYNKHIFNPITKKYIDTKKITCVRSKSSIEAEILSTTLMIANDEQLKEIIPNFNIEESIIYNL